jgi:small subunit ribosomal protein S6
MVILDPTVEERTVAPSLDKFLNVIRNGGGTVDKVDIWGRRRLAYEINKKTEGIYAVINVNANSADVLEVDRQLRLSEAVMRTKVLRADEAVVTIEPVVVPEVSAEEKAADKVEEAPAKAPAEKAPAEKAAPAAKAPAAKKAPVAEKAAPAAKAPAAEKPAAAKKPAVKKPAAKKAE